MKIVLAPDSFKESMSAYEACKALKKGIYHYNQSFETLLCPLADGGEGTLETLVYAMNGTIEEYEVSGTLFDTVKAPIGYVDNIAIIECATVCGLESLSEDQKDPYHTTTKGLGQLMKHALDHHADTIMICLGGSATNDGGIGMLSALGVQFHNENNESVPLTMQGLKELANIDISAIDKRLKDVHIIGVCDVENKLCGHQGATYIYGPQKGVKKDELEEIDHYMHKYATIADHIFHQDYQLMAGSGAAGGLGYALLAFCGAQLRSGFEVVSEIVQLEEKIRDCDIVIVGEGKMDRQTQYGKTPYGVLKIAQKHHKKVYAFAGKVEDQEILNRLGFQNVYAISSPEMKLVDALQQGKKNLEDCIYTHMEEIINEI